MGNDDNRDKKRDIPHSQTDTSSIEVTTTNVGDKDKKILPGIMLARVYN